MQGAVKPGPATLNEESRSVDVTVATDTDQVIRWDQELGYVPEILIMSGCRMPENGTVPLLDSHGRYSVESVLGSVRDFRTEGGSVLGRAVYSTSPEADSAFIKTREGHLTDYSAGYTITKAVRLQAGETAVYDGRTYSGPAFIATEWRLNEVSACPIGADPGAKARSESGNENTDKERGERMPGTKKEEGNQETKAPETGERTLEKSSQPDVEKIRAEAAANEQTRVREIMAMCTRHNCPDLADNLVKDNKTVDQARASVLEHIDRQREAQRTPSPVFEHGRDEREKFRAAAEDGLKLRAGISLGKEKPEPGADELRGYSLRELAREAVVRSGHRPSGNPMEIVGRAFTTTDFPLLLGSIANASLSEGFTAAGETYSTWCDDSGSVPDFRPQTFLRVGEFDDLEEIPEHGEYKYGEIGEAKESVQIVKFGKLFAITREAVINDNLNAITDMPRRMGESAARKIGDLPYSVLIANSKMGDGLALFHADHKNLAGTGVVGSIGIETLDKAFTGMALQKGLNGKVPLNIRPSFLIAPVSVMGATEQFFKTDNIEKTTLISGDLTVVKEVNIYSGAVLTRVYDARLDADSLTAWYLAANKGKTVKLFFLNGNKTPYLESKQGWNVDGVEYKVRIEAAAKAMDWRGLYKNAGA